MKPVIAVERLSSFWPEAMPLLRSHCSEVKACRAADFEFDFTQAKALEDSNALLICTARANGSLVGYCIWYLTRNIIRLGQIIGLQSGWYVRPEKRYSATAFRLFRFALVELKARGVSEVYPHFWQSSPPGIADFFKRLGAIPAETVYRMELA